jgi:hypothetical protein
LIFLNLKGKYNLTISLIGSKLLKGFFIYFKEYSDDRKVKLMALKLRKYAIYSWRILRNKGLVRAKARSSFERR